MNTEINSRVWRKYCQRLVIVAAILIAVVGVLNWRVDPYLRFGVARYKNFNFYKPTAISQVRMGKAYEVSRGQYRTIFLGNSRFDVGLAPESSSIPARYRPAYNLSQPGTSAETSLAYFKHAMRAHCPETLIVGVDFFSFIRKPLTSKTEKRALTPDEKRLSDSSWHRMQQSISDSVSSALSITALRDSLYTIGSQSLPNVPNISSHGFSSGEPFINVIRREGQNSLFAEKNIEMARKSLERVAPAAASPELQALEELFSIATKHSTRVIVVIHPYHADILEIIDHTEQWSVFEVWKKEITRIADKHQAECWDFSGYSFVTTESVPNEDEKRLMQHYWESGHYRTAVGELMLQSIFGGDSSGFGVRLRPSNLPDHLTTIRNERSAYRDAHPSAANRINNLVEAVKEAN